MSSQIMEANWQAAKNSSIDNRRMLNLTRCQIVSRQRVVDMGVVRVRDTVPVLVVLVSVIVSVWCDEAEAVTVMTEDGALSGTEYVTAGGRTVTAFLGVPYARPPVGGLRFQEPQPVESWTGTRPAKSFSPSCVQLTLHTLFPKRILGEEDCLYLNIFTPAVTNTKKLNVIFYIHGGAFMFGSGEPFKPDFFLDSYDVVYVSINYRLGPFGFLSTEDAVIPGNNGLKDQVLALEWVQNNIERFGGDKNKVTISGLSAGGASVHLHYLSPLSRNLFHQGISMSGSALCPWVLAENAKMKAHMLANSVGCPTETSQSLLYCLQQKDARHILSQIEKIHLPWNDLPFSPFGLVIEKNSGSSAFLDRNPYEMLSEGNVKDAPWLISATTEEGLYPAAYFLNKEDMLRDLDTNWNKLAPHLLDFNNTIAPEQSNEVSELIRNYYLAENTINSYSKQDLTKMISDRLFLVDIERSARIQASLTKSPVFFYNFAYRGKYSTSEYICKCKDNLGVSHADDLMYIMNTHWFPLDNDEDKAMVNIMVDMWYSFVDSGVPSPRLDTVWTPVSPDAVHDGNMTYLLISSSTDILQTSSSDLSNRKFWDKLPFSELWNTNENSKRYYDEL